MTRILDNLLWNDRDCHRTCTICCQSGVVFPAGSTFRLCQACRQWMWSFRRRTEVCWASCFVKLVVLVAVVRFVTARSLIFLVIGFVAFVVRFVVMVVRLVLSGVGFFVEAFPMLGINVMCKGLHFGKCRRLPLLTHNVFDAFCESRIVAVLEDTFISAGADSETVEFNVILYNMLFIVHFEVIYSVFSISGGVYGTELSA